MPSTSAMYIVLCSAMHIVQCTYISVVAQLRSNWINMKVPCSTFLSLDDMILHGDVSFGGRGQIQSVTIDQH